MALRRTASGSTARRDASIVAAVALVVFAVESIAWPLTKGRDWFNYLFYYADFWTTAPTLPFIQEYHTPLAPLLFGGSLEVFGALPTEALAGVAFAVSVAAVYLAGEVASGPRVGVVAALAVMLFPPYGALFHQVSSDAPFALATAVWMPLFVRALLRPTLRLFAANGIVLAGAFLVRPLALALLLLAAVLLLLVARADGVRARALGAAAVLAAAAPILVGWALLNDARTGDFTLSRGGNAVIPFYRVLVYDGLVDPSNGPATQELARAVEKHLLPLEPYRTFDIDLDEFFHSGSNRMWSDLVPMSDRVWGWDDNYAHLRAAGVEAVRAQPRRFAEVIASDLRVLLTGSYALAAPHTGPPPSPPAGDFLNIPTRKGKLVVTEGEPIPASNTHWVYTRPDAALRVDWSRPDRPRLLFQTPKLRRGFLDANAEVVQLAAKVPARDGSEGLASALNRVADHYPPPLLWLAVGVVGLAVRRDREAVALALLALVGVVVLFVTTLGQPAKYEYRIPFDPIFILFGVSGLAAVAELVARAAALARRHPGEPS